VLKRLTKENRVWQKVETATTAEDLKESVELC
jgi:hypothetical protein